MHIEARDAKRGGIGNDLPINSTDSYATMTCVNGDILANHVTGFGAERADYDEWANYGVPDDRSTWHQLVRQFYDYWLSIAPPGGLPGRQHVEPEKMTPWLSRLWLLDIHRDPMRFRCRLVGSDMVRSIGREVTGAWLDEVHPQSVTNASSRGRFRIVAELGRATWRHGVPRWARLPDYQFVESCLVPLARDGRTPDKVMALSVMFDANGKLL